MASDVLIFIDANQYLRVFNQVAGKKLLAMLGEQHDRIFISKQIVDEVNRNKLNVASIFFANQLKAIPLRTFTVPDHLFGMNEFPQGLRGHLKKLEESLGKVKEQLTQLVVDTLQKISKSADETSLRLKPIFVGANDASPDEMKRARERRERGNPPGKTDDPLGDQITWEQLLSRCTNVKKLWIITADRDFTTAIESAFILNPVLQADLTAASATIEVKCFDSLADGLEDFAKNAGVEANELPTEPELEAIRNEERTFPYIPWDSMMSQAIDTMQKQDRLRAQLKDPDYLANLLLQITKSPYLDPSVLLPPTKRDLGAKGGS